MEKQFERKLRQKEISQLLYVGLVPYPGCLCVTSKRTKIPLPDFAYKTLEKLEKYKAKAKKKQSGSKAEQENEIKIRTLERQYQEGLTSFARHQANLVVSESLFLAFPSMEAIQGQNLDKVGLDAWRLFVQALKQKIRTNDFGLYYQATEMPDLLPTCEMDAVVVAQFVRNEGVACHNRKIRQGDPKAQAVLLHGGYAPYWSKPFVYPLIRYTEDAWRRCFPGRSLVDWENSAPYMPVSPSVRAEEQWYGLTDSTVLEVTLLDDEYFDWLQKNGIEESMRAHTDYAKSISREDKIRLLKKHNLWAD